jgi:hypothetical protein
VTITHGYATVLEFKDHLQDNRLDDNDEAVERVIEAASRIIDGATQRRFWADEFPSSRLFRATPYTALFVDDYVELVSVTPETDIGVLGTAYPSTDYRAGPLNAAVQGWPYSHIEGSFSSWWSNMISVEAVWGWPSVPKAITQACLMMSARLYKRREAINGTLGFDEFALRLSNTDPDVASLIAPYRFTPVLVG